MLFRSWRKVSINGGYRIKLLKGDLLVERSQFSFRDPMGTSIVVYRWDASVGSPRGVVQVAHGMAETAARYQYFAKKLNEAGYTVYANDHRGHGKTAGDIDDLGNTGKDGFVWMVKNLHQLNGLIHEQHPHVPIYLFGHSMGSFLLQRYMALFGDTIRGAILSGSDGHPGATIHLGIVLAYLEMAIKGKRHKSQFLTNLAFAQFNRPFEPARTPFDWLSRDEDQVDKYIDNPYCGTIFPTEFYYYFFKGLRDNFKTAHIRQIPVDLPVYIVSGDHDPVGKMGKGVQNLYRRYLELGLRDVHCNLYPGGRHEMLKEINRDEVIADIVQWLGEHP